MLQQAEGMQINYHFRHSLHHAEGVPISLQRYTAKLLDLRVIAVWCEELGAQIRIIEWN